MGQQKYVSGFEIVAVFLGLFGGFMALQYFVIGVQPAVVALGVVAIFLLYVFIRLRNAVIGK